MALRKDEDIRFRVSSILKQQVQERADELQKSVSEYVTDLIKADLKDFNKKERVNHE